MTWIKNNSKVSGGSGSSYKPRRGTIFFETYDKAYNYARANQINPDKIIAKYTSYKIEL